MALDKKASELPDATNPRTASWAAYEDDGSGPTDVRMTMDMVRPGVSAFGLRLALGANLQAVAGAISADITDPVTIRWQAAARVVAGDPLHAFIQSTLGWSDSQMTTLMTAAAAYE